MKFVRAFRAMMFAVGFPLGAAAQLAFETTEVKLGQPKGAETSLIAEFPFKNTGSTAVKILETRVACGCTVPEIVGSEYAPGASGVVKVRFNFGTRQGLQTKRVVVRTDSGEYVLTLTAELPERLLVTPRLMVFRPGEPTERVFKVEVRADAPLWKIELASASSAYTATIVEKVAGTQYEVRLALTEAAPRDLRETVRLRTVGASGVEHVETFFIRRVE